MQYSKFILNLYNECLNVMNNNEVYSFDYPNSDVPIIWVTKEDNEFWISKDNYEWLVFDHLHDYDNDPDVGDPEDSTHFTFVFKHVIKKLKYKKQMEEMLK